MSRNPNLLMSSDLSFLQQLSAGDVLMIDGERVSLLKDLRLVEGCATGWGITAQGRETFEHSDRRDVHFLD